MDDKRGLWQALLAWLNSEGEGVQPASQQVAEQTAEALPNEVMPMEAIKRKREQLAQLDDLTRE